MEKKKNIGFCKRCGKEYIKKNIEFFCVDCMYIYQEALFSKLRKKIEETKMKYGDFFKKDGPECH